MSENLRKKITIRSNCSLSLYGGTFGPIRAPFYETVRNIARLIGDGIEVYEETPNGPVRLTMVNFDKFEDDEERMKKEAEQAKIRAEELERKRQARLEEERQRRERQQQMRNRQKNKNNNQVQQQQPQAEVQEVAQEVQQPVQQADVIVEE